MLRWRCSLPLAALALAKEMSEIVLVFLLRREMVWVEGEEETA